MAKDLWIRFWSSAKDAQSPPKCTREIICGDSKSETSNRLTLRAPSSLVGSKPSPRMRSPRGSMWCTQPGISSSPTCRGCDGSDRSRVKSGSVCSKVIA